MAVFCLKILVESLDDWEGMGAGADSPNGSGDVAFWGLGSDFFEVVTGFQALKGKRRQSNATVAMSHFNFLDELIDFYGGCPRDWWVFG